ncbi:division/cell wall cluster transcriptional repressor MraZ [Fusibacillus kribbianus]|uniref:Transcriptional regulator MraZ n=1 Tax=Fusibacillus kribbianus TaxID=3044208 RepID=A0AAP4B949_9FIRM|nr:division/cell wall cluster transcriptional repressor MraZ [Ruminococcus sp. YH-rum2234]MDI9241335.1 division/cell wall cluster transcriptional repressor MraZ [Ruminococcus sp. YH-rum2234]
MTNQFMGEYNHTMDAKGRLIVPARFREAGGDKFIVTKGLDKCLFVFTEDKWSSVVSSISHMPLTSGNARKFSRFFIGSAGECEVDKQGRILIPASLRAYADLAKDVVLVGVGSRVEIWNKDAWDDASEYDGIEEIAEGLEELRF